MLQSAMAEDYPFIEQFGHMIYRLNHPLKQKRVEFESSKFHPYRILIILFRDKSQNIAQLSRSLIISGIWSFILWQ